MNFATKETLKFLHRQVTNGFLNHGFRFNYKSAYALENLYPKSNLNIYTPNFVPEDPSQKFNGYIPLNKLDITYSCSSGPGGQHVNRVNTKVDLRFHVKTAPWIPEDLKDKILDKHKNRINKEGYLIIKSEITRSQHLNLADALEKLRAMIRTVSEPIKQTDSYKLEEIRKRQIQAARRRLFEKRMHSLKKSNRRENFDE